MDPLLSVVDTPAFIARLNGGRWMLTRVKDDVTRPSFLAQVLSVCWTDGPRFEVLALHEQWAATARSAQRLEAVDQLVDVASPIDIGSVAAMAGLTEVTIQSYVQRETIPEPMTKIGNTRLWTRRQIVDWQANRPGPGRETDLLTPAGIDHI